MSELSGAPFLDESFFCAMLEKFSAVCGCGKMSRRRLAEKVWGGILPGGRLSSGGANDPRKARGSLAALLVDRYMPAVHFVHSG